MLGIILTAAGVALAVFFGIAGMVQAHKANTTAGEAMDSANEASATGREALDVAKRTEARSTESSNVHWTGDWADVGIYRMVNMGDDDAHDVRLILTIDGVDARSSTSLVGGKGGYIEVEVPKSVRDRYLSEKREYQKWKREYERQSPYGYPFRNPSAPQHWHHIRQRVDWTTKSGSPDSHDEIRPTTCIGPDY